MAGADAEVRFVPKYDNKGLLIKIRNTVREIDKQKASFDKTTKSIREQEATLAKMRRELEAITQGEKVPTSINVLRSALREVDREMKAIQKENKTLIESQEAAVARVAKLGKMGFQDTDTYKVVSAEAERLTKTLAPIQEKMDGLSHKGAELEDKIAGLKLNPDSGEEFQTLADKIKNAEIELEKSKEQALGLQQSIMALARVGIDESLGTDFTSQAKIAEVAISEIESRLQGLKGDLAAALEAKKAPSAIVALRHEIVATENELDKFKSSLSQPIKDVMALRQLESEARAANEEVKRLQDLVSAEKSPESIEKLTAELNNAKNEAGRLDAELEKARNADFSPLAQSADNSAQAIKRAMDEKPLNRFKAGVQKISSGFGRFFSVASSGASALVRGIGRISGSMTVLNKHAQKTSGTLAKLGHRVRDLVVAAFTFNILRKGLSQLRTYLGGLLKTNDQFVKSLNAIKVNLMTAFQSIFDAIMPAINALMAGLAKLTGYMAAFTSALFGKTYAQSKDAAEQLNAEADALKNVGKEAKEAGKSLQGFDELNTLAADGAGDEGAGGIDWNIEPPDDAAFEWADNLINRLRPIFDSIKAAWDALLNSILSAYERWKERLLAAWQRLADAINALVLSIVETFRRLFGTDTWATFLDEIFRAFTNILNLITAIADAFRNAWNGNDRGLALLESITNMCTEILALANDIADAFIEAWNETGMGESIFANTLDTIANISDAIANIVAQFREAWNSDGNGIAVWESILSMVESVTGGIERITAAIAEWAGNLDFEPLLTGFRDLLAAIEPIVDSIMDGLDWAFQNIILPFGEWLIELAVPAALEALATAFDALGAVLDAISPGLEYIWESFLKPIAEWTGGKIIEILGMIQEYFGILADVFTEKGDKISNILMGIGTALNVLWTVWLKPLLGIIWSAVSGVFGGVVSFIGDTISVLIDIFSGIVDFLTGVFTGDWELAWGGIKDIFSGVAQFLLATPKAILTGLIEFVSGIGETILQLGKDVGSGLLEGIGTIFKNITSWLKENIFDPFVSAFKALFGIHSPSTVMAEIGKNIIQGLINGIGSLIGSVTGKVGEILSGITGKLGEGIAKAREIGASIMNAIGTGMSSVKESVVSTAKSIASNIAGGVSDAVSKAKEIGANIANAIGSGMSSATGAVTEQAKEVGRYITDGVKGIFDINSPSRVFRDEIGAMLGEGVAVGFAQTAGLIKNAFAGTIEGAGDDLDDFGSQGYSIGMSLLQGLELAYQPILDFFRQLMGDIQGIVSGSMPVIPQITIPPLPRSGFIDSAIISSMAERGRQQGATETSESDSRDLLQGVYEVVHRAFSDALDQSGRMDDILDAILQGKEIIVDGQRFGRILQNANNRRADRLGASV